MIYFSFHLKIGNQNPRIYLSVIYFWLEGTWGFDQSFWLEGQAKSWTWSGEGGEDRAVAVSLWVRGAWLPTQGSEGRQAEFLSHPWPQAGSVVTIYLLKHVFLTYKMESQLSFWWDYCQDIMRLYVERKWASSGSCTIMWYSRQKILEQLFYFLIIKVILIERKFGKYRK